MVTTELAPAKRLHSELAVLFGRDLVEQAHRTDVVDLDLTASFMDSIELLAEQILTHQGDPAMQRELVNTLIRADRHKALVLCMWLMDTSSIFSGQ